MDGLDLYVSAGFIRFGHISPSITQSDKQTPNNIHIAIPQRRYIAIHDYMGYPGAHAQSNSACLYDGILYAELIYE